MNLSKFKPVKIGTEYIVKMEKFPRDVYLGVTSKGVVVETNIHLAKEVSTLQEALNLAYAFNVGISYNI